MQTALFLYSILGGTILLKEQDDIAITKRRLTLIQTIIKHSLIAIVTITLAIPIIYWTINASLEASINNYRRSETIFKSIILSLSSGSPSNITTLLLSVLPVSIFSLFLLFYPSYILLFYTLIIAQSIFLFFIFFL
mgnify:CR=1 FL=1